MQNGAVWRLILGNWARNGPIVALKRRYFAESREHLPKVRCGNSSRPVFCTVLVSLARECAGSFSTREGVGLDDEVKALASIKYERRRGATLGSCLARFRGARIAGVNRSKGARSRYYDASYALLLPPLLYLQTILSQARRGTDCLVPLGLQCHFAPNARTEIERSNSPRLAPESNSPTGVPALPHRSKPKRKAQTNCFKLPQARSQSIYRDPLIKRIRGAA